MNAFVVVCFCVLSVVMHSFEIDEQGGKSIVGSMEFRMQEFYLTLLDLKHN